MPDDSFKEFVLDQLSALPELRAKAMFGAHGIYSGGKFFGILDEGRLLGYGPLEELRTREGASSLESLFVELVGGVKTGELSWL